jgi:uncharacterized tellurite resistance protein B-like protein
MLDRIRELLSALRTPAQPVTHSFEQRQLAAAALMVEAAAMDDTFDADERVRIDRLIQDRFGRSADEAADLMAQAEQAALASVEWHGFTRAIKDGFDHAERVQLIEMLWEVAYADRRLHDYEASLLRAHCRAALCQRSRQRRGAQTRARASRSELIKLRPARHVAAG